jgi:hypothetical protein
MYEAASYEACLTEEFFGRSLSLLGAFVETRVNDCR